ncbi:calcium/sodium antiporter [Conservatibacter flavescens]|uniref:Calcium/sodium antiporter n=1 Tax=Conservatibacter flavescens TaxID=28161 RepID=A0A2M8S406_9PAST|nr:calcium/sodium antiporter [Conservatibacter flavescens]PJG85879.1 calcium/sodium antiporter [Conservatibacter flavescens]
MLEAVLAIVGGLILLIWSADRFIDGAAITAKHFGMPQLLIGIVIIGFGTSAPEIIVSTISALNGNPGIALGNAYGSNITNIALILGLTALISPIIVHSQVLKKELPVLAVITLLSAGLLYDATVSRLDATILLALFTVYMIWTIYSGMRHQNDDLAHDVQDELAQKKMSLKMAIFWIFIGLALLIVSSQLLVWGAVEVAQYFGVSDLIIGLTIVAVGTSLPELASSLIAAKKGEHDLAVGNIIGSNLFNTLAVVGLAGVIQPMEVDHAIFNRDMLTMTALTFSLFLFGYGFKKRQGRINRIEGAILLLAYIAYNSYLFYTAI